MAQQIQFRRGTAAAWTAANPTLANGEVGYETDTHKQKFGDGATAWNSLGYSNVVPAGGTTAQALKKASNADYDLVWGDVASSDATLTVSDITTNNVSTTKHGFAPKAPNDATKALDGTGAYSTFQAPLVSGTNIRTVNGNTLLGSTDLVISASPGGTSGAVQGNTSSAFAAIPGFTYNTTTGALTHAAGTITTSAPALTITQTWNAGAVTFNGFNINVTNTASAAASTLLDLQIAGTSKLSVNVAGGVSLPNGTATIGTVGTIGWPSGGNFLYGTNNGVILGWGGTASLALTNVGLRVKNDAFVLWGSGTPDTNSADAGIGRNAAGVLEINSSAAGTFRDLKLRNLMPQVFTVGTLPSASTQGNGARSHVSDATAPTFGATVAGSGAVSTPVYSDATNWKVG